MTVADELAAVRASGVLGAGVCVSTRCGCGGLIFTCPTCHRTSHHPQDARNGYCGACHDWTGLLPIRWPAPEGIT